METNDELAPEDSSWWRRGVMSARLRISFTADKKKRNLVGSEARGVKVWGAMET